MVEAFRTQWREILASAFVRMSEQAPFYIFITFVLTYGTAHLKLSRGSLLNDTLVAAAVGLVSVPLFGHLSDKIGRRTMYGIGIACVALFAFPYFGLLNTTEPGLVLLAIVLSLVFHDMQYGPQAALIAESFGTNIRYSGAGLGYQLASVIAGGPAPLIAAAILAATGSSTGISIYILICCALSAVALALMPRQKVTETSPVIGRLTAVSRTSRHGELGVAPRRDGQLGPVTRLVRVGCTVEDGLDVVAVEVADEHAVVARVVLRELAGRVQDLQPGLEGGGVHGVDGGPVGGAERDVRLVVRGARRRAEPEVRHAVRPGHAHDGPGEAHRLAHAERREQA